MQNLVIKHLKNSQINRVLWDRCVQDSFNGSVFAYAWYLDLNCDNWEALVAGNYEIIMPLPLFEKWGYKIIFQPKLIEQLGVFSTTKLSPEIIAQFIDAIPYKNISLRLNALNPIPNNSPHLDEVLYPTLDLISSYDQIKSKFPSGTLEIIERANKNHIFVSRSVTPEEYIQFSTSNRKIPFLPTRKRSFTRLITFISRYKSAGFYGAYDHTNSLIAIAFVIKTNKRLIILDAVGENGKMGYWGTIKIMHYIIKLNAEKNLVLDFALTTKEWGYHFTKNLHAFGYMKKGWLTRLAPYLFDNTPSVFPNKKSNTLT